LGKSRERNGSGCSSRQHQHEGESENVVERQAIIFTRGRKIREYEAEKVMKSEVMDDSGV
jgi:hypothetical protein